MGGLSFRSLPVHDLAGCQIEKSLEPKTLDAKLLLVDSKQIATARTGH